METLEALETIYKKLKPEEFEKFRAILDLIATFKEIQEIVLKDIDAFGTTYAKCSNFICNNMPDKKTVLFGPTTIMSYVIPLDKAGEQYHLLSKSMRDNLRKWNAREDYGREIIKLIIKKGNTKEVIKGLEKLFNGYTKQIEEIKNYNILFSEVLNKLNEIEKKLSIVMN